MKVFEAGAAIEFKSQGGLAPWRSGKVVSFDAGLVTVDDGRGNTYEVARSRVRVPKDKAARGARAPSSLRGAIPRDAPPAVAPTPKPTIVRAAPEALDTLVAKRGAWRSPAYLTFVRARPCCSCGAAGYSDASHHGRRPMGRKTDDFRTIPLCRVEHDRYHATACIGQRDPEQTKAFINEQLVELFGEFMKRHTFRSLTEDELVALAAPRASRRSA